MSRVDIDHLRALLAVLAEEDIAEFEHESEGVRLRIVRRTAHAVVATPAHVTHAHASAAAPVGVAGAAAAESADSVDVTCPFVGSVVRPGQTLCIVEAMKLMNEIEAEMSGTIVEIFAQNGKSVEFGQKLFRIKKA